MRINNFEESEPLLANQVSDGREQQSEVKEKILNTAAALFAEYGFASVGVREIARESGVNLSMISYYFNGKTGLLKEILRLFFEDLNNIIIEVKSLEMKSESNLKQIVSRIITLYKTKPSYFRAAVAEMTVNQSELSEYKVNLLLQHLRLIVETFHVCSAPALTEDFIIIVGPAFFSMIYSNFIFGGLLKKKYEVNYDDEFLEKYSVIISKVFLDGVRGLWREIEHTNETVETNNNGDKGC